jgi:hypothetical protein
MSPGFSEVELSPRALNSATCWVSLILTHLGLWSGHAHSPPAGYPLPFSLQRVVAASLSLAASPNGVVRPGVPRLAPLQLPGPSVAPATPHLPSFRLTARPPAAVSSPPSRRGRALR